MIGLGGASGWRIAMRVASVGMFFSFLPVEVL